MNRARHPEPVVVTLEPVSYDPFDHYQMECDRAWLAHDRALRMRDEGGLAAAHRKLERLLREKMSRKQTGE
jgi:hypothetical protein